MKRLFVAILVCALAITAMAVNVSAAYISNPSVIVVQDVNGSRKHSVLTISSNNAKCTSTYVESNTQVRSIKVVQVLEKKNSNGTFTSVSGGTWTTTVYSSTASVTSEKKSITSGTYRLKTVFTATLSNGTTETTTVYSSNKTIN